jgi:hypothetical protein
MKTYYFLFAFVLFLFSCSDSEDDNTPQCSPPEKGDGGFYRLTALSEVNVIPEEYRVRLLFRVADSMNVGVPGLTIDNFIIQENCKDQIDDSESDASIDARDISSRIQTSLVIDISGSLAGMVGRMKEAVIELINSKVSNQEFAIYTFSRRVNLVQDFTSDITELENAINSIPEEDLDNSTSLYQAIIDAAENCVNIITIDEIIYGDIIVFTDGNNNADNLDVSDVLNKTQGINIYVAALKSGDLAEEELKQIASGEDNYLYFENIDKLKDSFFDIQDKVENESKSTYFLNYESPLAVGGTQKLRVMIKNNRNIGNDAFIEKTFSSDGFEN